MAAHLFVRHWRNWLKDDALEESSDLASREIIVQEISDDLKVPSNNSLPSLKS